MALSLMCDLRYISRSTVLSIPAAKLGIAYRPDWIRLLALTVGTTVASEILLTANSFNSKEIEKWGFANECFDDNTIEKQVRIRAQKISSLAPLSLKANKIGIRLSLPSSSKPDIMAVMDACQKCDNSFDLEEGIRAFKEKNKPTFIGN